MKSFRRGIGELGSFHFTSITKFIFAALLLPFSSWAGGVVSNCDEASLRAAMSGGGTVTFACDGTITVTSTLVIDTDTIFDATGHDVTIDGNFANRVFEVQRGVTCTMTGLKIVNGLQPVEGAGVLNSGVLTLQRCLFSNNVASAMLGTTRGGAVMNSGTMNVLESTFIANQARGLAGSLGGAIHNGGTLRLNGSTFIQNQVSGSGGAISTLGSATAGAGITNCTFYGNTANQPGSALHTDGSGLGQYVSVVNCTFARHASFVIQSLISQATVVANCIVAGGTVSATDGGNNIVGTTIDPRLGPLADNGGPTLTMEPLPDSPAIDQGNNQICPPTDQRGVARPIRARCDIGAVETTSAPTPSVIQFASAAASVNEDAANATINVLRLGNSAPTVSVNYTTANGTAVVGQDYGFTSGTLTFEFGQTNATITVPILNDQAPESAETFTVTLSAPSAEASLGDPATMTLTIQDDDPAQPGTLRFQQGIYSAGEGGLDAIISVIRTGGTNGTVTVDFATSDGTAVAGQDYTPTQGTLTFGDTEASKSLVVRIATDAISEGLETFSVTLSSPGVAPHWASLQWPP